MKRSLLFSYFFVPYFMVMSFLPGLDFGQMLKFHHLWAHYEQESNEKISFLSFLVEHYLDFKGGGEHRDLPFLNLQIHNNFFLLHSFCLDKVFVRVLLISITQNTYRSGYYFLPAHVAWNPPRQV